MSENEPRDLARSPLRGTITNLYGDYRGWVPADVFLRYHADEIAETFALELKARLFASIVEDSEADSKL